jgi:hypothetical protein
MPLRQMERPQVVVGAEALVPQVYQEFQIPWEEEYLAFLIRSKAAVALQTILV